MTFNIYTLGCKVNIYESEVIKEMFLKSGYILGDDFNNDIVIINTCSVTNMADIKSRKLIHKIKRDNMNSILVVCGCSAENHREELLKTISEINILIGNVDKTKIVSLVEEFKMTNNKYNMFYPNDDLSFEDMQVEKFTTHTRAFIKIQDGCDNYCSYCIIPIMRGNLRFKDFDKAIEEAKTLVDNGHKEIVLTGIHTGSYGRGTTHDLSDLINEMSKIKGLKRIRISSIEITEITPKFLETLKNNPKVCDHLHIPLQSGCDKVLQLMNRRYKTDYYSKKIADIRAIRPDINISTDVIVGFPDENDEDFLFTLNYCKEIGFSKLHIFPYSKRIGTKAALMSNQIPENIKKIRAKQLAEISDSLEKKYYEKFINKNLEIITEETKDNKTTGFTSNYIKVEINDSIKSNEIVQVKIKDLNKVSVKADVKIIENII